MYIYDVINRILINNNAASCYRNNKINTITSLFQQHIIFFGCLPVYMCGWWIHEILIQQQWYVHVTWNLQIVPTNFSLLQYLFKSYSKNSWGILVQKLVYFLPHAYHSIPHQ